MSSETSTDEVRLKADTAVGALPGRNARLQPDQSLQPWQFFVLAGLSCATALTFIVRGEGLTAVILLTVLMGATALVGLAALKAIRPLVTDHEDRTLMIGERTRAALEREKMLALRAIKELEFDHAMGKIAADDFRDMEARLRARAIRLMRQLDAGAGYRERIERDLAKRIGAVPAPDPQARMVAPAETGKVSPEEGAGHDSNLPGEAASTRTCSTCTTPNDADARFCKGCGQPL